MKFKKFKQAQKFAVEYPKIFSLIMVGIFLVGMSGIFIFHPLSQFEVFLLPSVWNPCDNRIQFYTDLMGNGYNSFASVPATDFFYHGTVGQLTDLMESFLAIGWIMGMVGVGFVSLGFMMFISQQSQAMKKELEVTKMQLNIRKKLDRREELD